MTQTKPPAAIIRTDDIWWGTKTNLAGGKETPVVGYTAQSCIYFYADVTVGTISELNKTLRELEVLNLQEAVARRGDPRPITLYINSYGGSIFAGIAGMDAILKSRVPVHTVVEGAAASAATLLSVCGQTRFITPNSYMLIHQLSSGVFGKYDDIKEEVRNLDELMKMIKNIYITKTNIQAEVLDEMLSHDIWFPAQQCLDLKLVDIIL